MNEHINPITGRDERPFRERKAARIAAGQRTFTFHVIGDSPDYPAPIEIGRAFTSKREAMAFAYDPINTFGVTAAHRALSFAGHRSLPFPQFTVYRKDCATGERTRVAGYGSFK